jgi:hypothetical protein
MRVRVYDKETNKYFRSEVYAVINSGYYERWLVLVPDGSGDYFKLYDYLDKESAAPHYFVNINIITPLFENWIGERDSLKLKEFSGIETPDEKFFYSFRGFPRILENRKALSSLLRGEAVTFEELNPPEITSKLEGWNYIDDASDAEKLLNEARGFHDTVIVEINYISGSKNMEHGTFDIDDVRRVTINFSDGGWCPPIELVFEGVTEFHLRPAPDNYSSDIYEATLKFLSDETIFFCVDEAENEIDAKNSTWIKALNLRWRFR